MSINRSGCENVYDAIIMAQLSHWESLLVIRRMQNCDEQLSTFRWSRTTWTSRSAYSHL